MVGSLQNLQPFSPIAGDCDASVQVKLAKNKAATFAAGTSGVLDAWPDRWLWWLVVAPHERCQIWPTLLGSQGANPTHLRTVSGAIAVSHHDGNGCLEQHQPGEGR